MKKRNQLLVFLAMLVSGLGESIAIAQTDSTPVNTPNQAVIEAVQSYVDAFNRRDAAAISDHWSESGEFVDADGNRVTGRENIRQAFEAVFAGLTDNQVLSVTVNRVSLVTPDVAMEEGTASMVDGDETDYVAIHKLEDGRWNLFSVRDSELRAPPSHYDQLKDLEWMIGSWVDHSDEATVESSCRWSNNRNFITKNFRVSIPGMDPLEGTQVIGYDASTGNIRSWLFDSDGGFANGVWTQKGNSWEVQSSQVLADGRIGSSVNIYTPLDQNQFSWKSIGRTLDGESLPDVQPVNVFRVQDEADK